MLASSLFPDNGLASLAGTLLAAGHRVKVLDFNTVSVMGRLVPRTRTESLSELLPALARGPTQEELARLLQINAELEMDLTILAESLLEQLCAEVDSVGADFVGFKLWSGDGFSASVSMPRGCAAASLS